MGGYVSQEGGHPSHYRRVAIPKKGGGARLIYIPSPPYKRRLQQLLPALERLQGRVCNPEVVHGFVPGRSPVTNAAAHVGSRFTVSMDIKDWFDSVTPAMLSGKVPPLILALVMIDGAPRQGLPTSPFVANIATADLDQAIIDAIKASGHIIRYTRYADDLTFSTDDPSSVEWVRQNVPPLIEGYGLTLNHRKTRVQDGRYVRRCVTGVSIREDGVLVAPRRVRRRLRALAHLSAKRTDNRRIRNQAHGLSEWCRMRMPWGVKRPWSVPLGDDAWCVALPVPDGTHAAALMRGDDLPIIRWKKIVRMGKEVHGATSCGITWLDALVRAGIAKRYSAELRAKGKKKAVEAVAVPLMDGRVAVILLNEWEAGVRASQNAIPGIPTISCYEANIVSKRAFGLTTAIAVCPDRIPAEPPIGALVAPKAEPVPHGMMLWVF